MAMSVSSDSYPVISIRNDEMSTAKLVHVYSTRSRNNSLCLRAFVRLANWDVLPPKGLWPSIGEWSMERLNCDVFLPEVDATLDITAAAAGLANVSVENRYTPQRLTKRPKTPRNHTYLTLISCGTMMRCSASVIMAKQNMAAKMALEKRRTTSSLCHMPYEYTLNSVSVSILSAVELCLDSTSKCLSLQLCTDIAVDDL